MAAGATGALLGGISAERGGESVLVGGALGAVGGLVVGGVVARHLHARNIDDAMWRKGAYYAMFDHAADGTAIRKVTPGRIYRRSSASEPVLTVDTVQEGVNALRRGGYARMGEPAVLVPRGGRHEIHLMSPVERREAFSSPTLARRAMPADAASLVAETTDTRVIFGGARNTQVDVHRRLETMLDASRPGPVRTEVLSSRKWTEAKPLQSFADQEAERAAIFANHRVDIFDTTSGYPANAGQPG